jgi:hypothetical protein
VLIVLWWAVLLLLPLLLWMWRCVEVVGLVLLLVVGVPVLLVMVRVLFVVAVFVPFIRMFLQ